MIKFQWKDRLGQKCRRCKVAGVDPNFFNEKKVFSLFVLPSHRAGSFGCGSSGWEAADTAETAETADTPSFVCLSVCFIWNKFLSFLSLVAKNCFQVLLSEKILRQKNKRMFATNFSCLFNHLVFLTLKNTFEDYSSLFLGQVLSE